MFSFFLVLVDVGTILICCALTSRRRRLSKSTEDLESTKKKIVRIRHRHKVDSEDRGSQPHRSVWVVASSSTAALVAVVVVVVVVLLPWRSCFKCCRHRLE